MGSVFLRSMPSFLITGFDLINAEVYSNAILTRQKLTGSKNSLNCMAGPIPIGAVNYFKML